MGFTSKTGAYLTCLDQENWSVKTAFDVVVYHRLQLLGIADFGEIQKVSFKKNSQILNDR